MVKLQKSMRGMRAALNIELIVALGILSTAMVPLAYSFLQEIKLARQCYREAVAMELLDGEAEILAAGEWQSYAEGEHVLAVKSRSATNLPPGKFVVLRKGTSCRVEWRPAKGGRLMAREVRR
jgi:hypothetical protein